MTHVQAKGYMTRHIIDNACYETLYFVAPCGTIAETELIKCPNDVFFVHGRKFYSIKQLPKNAEYIGEYMVPNYVMEQVNDKQSVHR